MIEDITKEDVLDFTGEDSPFWIKLTQSPRDYIEQIKRMDKPVKLIKVKSTHSQEFYESLRELVINCSDEVCIKNVEVAESPNKMEFLKGEAIIDEVIAGINPEWNKKQKVAYVHHQVAKIISYIPDFNYRGNEVNVARDTRNMWNALANGTSVCNGITYITMSILSRLGIESQQLSNKSGSHSFLAAKTEEGNLLMDPTWDLYSNLYDAKPRYFGKSYEEIREMDRGFTAHLLENPPEDVLVLSEQELRELYYSIGLANEDRTFTVPILELVSKVNQMQDLNKKQKVEEFFSLYMKSFKKESMHICESKDMLGACMSEMDINERNIICVYLKEDVECQNPIMVFHSGEQELAGQIYLFPKDENEELKSMSIKEFDEKYKIHSRAGVIPFWKQYLAKDSIVREENIQSISKEIE